ncbi:hypothetical protein RM705_34955, partial [Streptomyces sp. DSM 41636]|nr:hypothetical protein [Streptomyces sp. DSM 41636]
MIRGRGLSALALGVTGALIAALATGCTSGEGTAGQTSFCWGTLSGGDAAKMSVRPLERYASDDDDLKSPYLVHCKV